MLRSECVPQASATGNFSSMGMKRTLLSWSSGKDSAWSLHLLQQQEEHEIVGLLTTFNQAADRVAMHAVRRILVEAQARRQVFLCGRGFTLALHKRGLRMHYEGNMQSRRSGGNRMHCVWGSLLDRYSLIPRKAIGRVPDWSQFFLYGAFPRGSLHVL